jgi:hypothetical protein
MNAPMNDRTMLGDLMANRKAQAQAQSASAKMLASIKALDIEADRAVEVEADPIRNIEQGVEGKRNLFLASW